MAAADTQTLLDEVKCNQCYGMLSVYDMLKISLLTRTLLALDPMAATDSQSLIEYAKCFNCYGPLSIGQMMELALIDQISQNIGATHLIGVPDPEGVVTAYPGASYYATGSQTFWVKVTGDGNTGWQQIVATAGAGIVGVPDPEGVQVANAGTTYFATGSTTFWVKATGAGNTGWVQLI